MSRVFAMQQQAKADTKSAGTLLYGRRIAPNTLRTNRMYPPDIEQLVETLLTTEGMQGTHNLFQQDLSRVRVKTDNQTALTKTHQTQIPISQTTTARVANLEAHTAELILVTQPSVEAEVPANTSDANIPVVAESEQGNSANPEENPAFQAVTDRVTTTAQNQQQTPPAEHEAEVAQRAARVPSNQRMAEAQTNQIEEMDAQEPETFDAEAFKTQLMQRIANMQLPTNLEEADDFEHHNNIQEIAQATATDVNREQERVASPIANTTATNPDVSAIPERQREALPDAPIGQMSSSVRADTAMPGPRSESQISQPMQEGVQAIEQEMANDGITERQLTSANEPVFTRAYDSMQEVCANTEQSPGVFREQETETLHSAQQQAVQSSSGNLAAMHQEREGIFGAVLDQQLETGSQDTAAREEVGQHIDSIFESTRAEVSGILDNLDERVSRDFERASTRAKQSFERYVAREMEAYKERRYSGLEGAARWVRDAFLSLPEEVNQFYVNGRQAYIHEMDIAISEIAGFVAESLTNAKRRISLGKQQVTDYVAGLDANLRAFGENAAENIQNRFDELTESVNGKRDELIDSLAQQYQDGLAEVDARIEEMRAEHQGLVAQFRNAYDEARNIVSQMRQLLTDLLAAARNLLDVIITAPVEFARNLFAGVRRGFENFVTNIQTHLLGGFIQWLTGALGSMGITIPDDLFSLGGIFNLVAQILGLTWDYIRGKAVRLVGEPVVGAIERGIEIFQIIRDRGVAGLWEYIKEQFNDLKEQVIDSIKDMLITRVIMAGIRWLVSLLIPGAGFIKAVIAIKDFLVFFVQSAMSLLPVIINAMQSLASGATNLVAGAVENGLVRLLPGVIELLARVLGLDRMADSVGKIILKLRKRIDKAINKLIMKAKRMLGRLVGRFRGAAGRVTQWWKNRKRFRADDGHQHALYFEGEGARATLMIASTPKTFRRFITEVDTGSDPAKQTAKANALSKLERIEALEQQASVTNNSTQSNNNQNNADEISRLLDEITTYVKSLFGDNAIAKYIDRKILNREKTNYLINNQARDEIRSSGYTFVQMQNNNIYIRRNSNNLLPVHIDDGGVLKPGASSNEAHNQYEPYGIIDKTPREDRNGYSITYKTKDFQGREGPEFTVDISYDYISNKNPDYTNIWRIEGRSLIRKPSGGARGYTPSAHRNFDNAHLIADMFGGSGFSNAANTYPSSQKFNRRIMREKEDLLDSKLRNSPTFNMTVSATIKGERPDDPGLITAIAEEVRKDVGSLRNINVNDNTLNEIVNSFKGEIRDDLTGLPGQFINVIYSVDTEVYRGREMINEEDPDYKTLIEDIMRGK